ncbi:DUF4259 domain-containing protein [Streptomyces rochei]|uniref:DUF4259 domain-containing protein n=1 Tax=Streptomyces TaxID=1883 RepID=UPI00332D560C
MAATRASRAISSRSREFVIAPWCLPGPGSWRTKTDGAGAVAAGALVASTLPDSPIVIDPDASPSQPLPELPASLRASARLALDRVLQDGSDMAIGWVDSADAEQWRQEVRQILRALETPNDH